MAQKVVKKGPKWPKNEKVAQIFSISARSEVKETVRRFGAENVQPKFGNDRAHIFIRKPLHKIWASFEGRFVYNGV